MTSDVLVLGGSIPGVVVALECAKLGLNVTLVCDRIDVPTQSVTDASAGWEWFTSEYAFEPLLEQPAEDFTLQGSGGGVSLPAKSILGIPSSPLAGDVVQAIGRKSAYRAYLDRIRPVLTIGKAHRIGELVRTRMGKVVLSTLVAPSVVNRFGATPDEVDVAVAIPGLNEAMTRTGSLSTAVLAMLDEDAKRETRYRIAPDADAFLEHITQQLRYWNVNVHSSRPEDIDLERAEFRCRALVCAGEASLANRLLPMGEVGLQDLPVRTHISVTCDDALPVGAIGLFRHDDTEWTYVVTERDTGVRSMLLSSARRTQSLSLSIEEAERRAGGHSEAVVCDAFSHVNLTQPHDATSIDCRVRPSLLTTLEEVHARNDILQTLTSLSDGDVVGDWLHAGDTSQSIIHAREVSTRLRRQLVGLT